MHLFRECINQMDTWPVVRVKHHRAQVRGQILRIRECLRETPSVCGCNLPHNLPLLLVLYCPEGSSRPDSISRGFHG